MAMQLLLLLQSVVPAQIITIILPLSFMGREPPAVGSPHNQSQPIQGRCSRRPGQPRHWSRGNYSRLSSPTNFLRSRLLWQQKGKRVRLGVGNGLTQLADCACLGVMRTLHVNNYGLYTVMALCGMHVCVGAFNSALYRV